MKGFMLQMACGQGSLKLIVSPTTSHLLLANSIINWNIFGHR